MVKENSCGDVAHYVKCCVAEQLSNAGADNGENPAGTPLYVLIIVAPVNSMRWDSMSILFRASARTVVISGAYGDGYTSAASNAVSSLSAGPVCGAEPGP